MSYTISNLKSDLNGILKGTTTNQITGIDQIINRAGRQLLLDIDPAETRRTADLTNALYDSVYDYALPSDIKGSKVVDIRPKVDRDGKFNQKYTVDFDFDKENNTYNIYYHDGLKTLRASKALSAGVNLTNGNSLTNEGTWATGGDAENLTLDTLNYLTGGGSLNFDLDGSGTAGNITVPLTTSVDISDHEDVGSLFVWVYIPDKDIITSFTLDWGSSGSAYWSNTVTTQNQGAFTNGWNLLRFDWNGATATGSGDSENVDYINFTTTYDGTADTDFRLDSIIVRTGVIYEIDYYTKYLFRDGATGNAWLEAIVDDDDYLQLDTDSYNIFLNKCAEFCCQHVRSLNADLAYFKNEYDMGVEKYQGDRKSEAIKPKAVYYDLFKR